MITRKRHFRHRLWPPAPRVRAVRGVQPCTGTGDGGGSADCPRADLRSPSGRLTMYGVSGASNGSFNVAPSPRSRPCSVRGPSERAASPAVQSWLSVRGLILGALAAAPQSRSALAMACRMVRNKLRPSVKIISAPSTCWVGRSWCFRPPPAMSCVS